MNPIETSIGIAVIGTGFGRYGMLPAFQMDSRCRVLSLVSTNLEKVREYAQALAVPEGTNDWKQVLERKDIHAVAIACPPDIQAQIIPACLRAKKAVLAEKPLCLSTAQAEDMVKLATSNNVAHAVDFIFPECETWQLAHKKIAHDLGRVRHFFVDWRMESFDYRKGVVGWKTDHQRGGGVLQHFATHSLYYLEWMLGPIKSVRAQLSKAPDLKFGSDTLATIHLTLENGASGALSVSNASTIGCGHRIEIYGSEGALKICNSTNDPIHGFELWYGSRASGILERIACEPVHTFGPTVDSRVIPLSRLVTRFLDWIEGGPECVPNLHQGLRVQRIVDAIQRSATTGAEVAIA